MSVMDAVLDHDNLFAGILGYLDTHELALAQGVSRKWWQKIGNSMPLREILHLQAVPVKRLVLWKRDTDNHGYCCGTCNTDLRPRSVEVNSKGARRADARVVTELHRILHKLASHSGGLAPLAPEAQKDFIMLQVDLVPLLLWDPGQFRNMLLTQPPCEQVQIRFQARGPRYGISTLLTEIDVNGGVTFGKLMSRLKDELSAIERVRMGSVIAQILPSVTIIIPGFVSTKTVELCKKHDATTMEDIKNDQHAKDLDHTNKDGWQRCERLIARRAEGPKKSHRVGLVLEDFKAFEKMRQVRPNPTTFKSEPLGPGIFAELGWDYS